jgi:protein-S-isoprenylcysteine O-methyltransferase Ste14
LGSGWNVAGAIGYAAGLALFSWAMIVNAFFSTAARIQDDRGQTVCQSGPYRFLRHPGYTGILLQSIGTPILLGSLWALIPGIATIGFMVARTVLEDRMLREELAGYAEYAGRVRFRLVPDVW